MMQPNPTLTIGDYVEVIDPHNIHEGHLGRIVNIEYGPLRPNGEPTLWRHRHAYTVDTCNRRFTARQLRQLLPVLVSDY